MKTATPTMSNPFGLGRPAARALVVSACVAAAAAGLFALGLHAPDWSILAARSPVVRAHAAAAVGALAVGGALMLGVKGRAFHRRLGWAGVLLILATAGSSVFIRSAWTGGLGPIHGLSAWTLLMLPIAVVAARRRQVVRHRRIMSGLFYGGLVIAGLFTFVPGRAMHEMFFG